MGFNPLTGEDVAVQTATKLQVPEGCVDLEADDTKTVSLSNFERRMARKFKDKMIESVKE
jgi:hypothetical protein